jgi:hypothetical protein
MDSDFAARSVHSSEWACWLSVRCCSSDGQGLAYLCCKSASGHSAARVVDNLSAGCLSQEFVGRGDMNQTKISRHLLYRNALYKTVSVCFKASHRLGRKRDDDCVQ